MKIVKIAVLTTALFAALTANSASASASWLDEVDLCLKDVNSGEFSIFQQGEYVGDWQSSSSRKFKEILEYFSLGKGRGYKVDGNVTCSEGMLSVAFHGVPVGMQFPVASRGTMSLDFKFAVPTTEAKKTRRQPISETVRPRITLSSGRTVVIPETEDQMRIVEEDMDMNPMEIYELQIAFLESQGR